MPRCEGALPRLVTPRRGATVVIPKLPLRQKHRLIPVDWKAIKQQSL